MIPSYVMVCYRFSFVAINVQVLHPLFVNHSEFTLLIDCLVTEPQGYRKVVSATIDQGGMDSITIDGLPSSVQKRALVMGGSLNDMINIRDMDIVIVVADQGTISVRPYSTTTFFDLQPNYGTQAQRDAPDDGNDSITVIRPMNVSDEPTTPSLIMINGGGGMDTIDSMGALLTIISGDNNDLAVDLFHLSTESWSQLSNTDGDDKISIIALRHGHVLVTGDGGHDQIGIHCDEGYVVAFGDTGYG
jgi:hypothetical protein